MKTGVIYLLILFFSGLFIFLVFYDNNLIENTSYTKENKSDSSNVEIIASDLNIPWEIVFLPNGEILVSERGGDLVRINKGSKIKVEGVNHNGEGGLLGVALHPNFENNNWIYVYFTSNSEGIKNRVERYSLNLDKNSLENKKIILDNIPGNWFHDGGRIAFGPDNYLYITTGDVGNPGNSQDTNSLAGKILRIDDEGRIPKDNPFGNEVYSYGHRNPQGITWDERGRLWATEHGQSPPSEFDELNLIEKGNNYGWPIIQGDEEKEGMKKPIIHSGGDNIWAPAGAVFYKGKIFFVGLRGESLYEYDIENKKLKSYFKNKFGRLRAVKIEEGYIYISTSNRDGRGTLNNNDDKILKVNLNDIDSISNN